MKKENLLILKILAGVEEIRQRRNFIYCFKSFLYREFQLFRKWGDKKQRYYEEKYKLNERPI